MTNYADLVDRLRQMAGTARTSTYEHDDVLAQSAEAIEALVARAIHAETMREQLQWDIEKFERDRHDLAARATAAEAERDRFKTALGCIAEMSPNSDCDNCPIHYVATRALQPTKEPG